MADEPWGLFQKAVGGGGENWVCWVVWPQRKVRFLPGPPRAHGPREAAGSPEIPVFPTLRLCPCRGLPGLGGVPWVCRGLLAFSVSQLWLTPQSALQRGAGRVPRSWPPQEGGWQSTSVPPAPGRPWPQGWEPLVLASPAGVSSGCGPEPGSWNVAGECHSPSLRFQGLGPGLRAQVTTALPADSPQSSPVPRARDHQGREALARHL